MAFTPFLRMPYLQKVARQALFQSRASATMHSAQRPSLKAPASESERRGRVLPPPSPLKPIPSTMMNTTLPTDRAPTRVQELTLSLPGRAGTSSSSGCRLEIICPHTLRCCSSRCRSCSAPRQPRRLRFGLRKCCVSAAAAQRQTSGRRQARQSGKARDRSRRANGEGVQECGGSGSSSRSASPSELWRGAGQCDDLVPHHLYSHMAKPRPGPKLPSCKGMPPVRYKRRPMAS